VGGLELGVVVNCHSLLEDQLYRLSGHRAMLLLISVQSLDLSLKAAKADGKRELGRERF
jgi:hypothetical protein